MLVVVEGRKPKRPPSGFSDNLWNILLKVWDPEYGSQPPKRPPISSILAQMRKDGDDWNPPVLQPSEWGRKLLRSVSYLGLS